MDTSLLDFICFVLWTFEDFGLWFYFEFMVGFLSVFRHFSLPVLLHVGLYVYCGKVRVLNLDLTEFY